MEQVEKSFLFADEKGQVECVLRGMSVVPFWSHDLKLRAALALIQSVDVKDFDDKEQLFYDLLEKIHEVLVFHGYYCVGDSEEYRT